MRNTVLKKAACVSCHQKKIRCDTHVVGLPCSNCVRGERPDCRYHQKRKRGEARVYAHRADVTSHSHVSPVDEASPTLEHRSEAVSTSSRSAVSNAEAVDHYPSPSQELSSPDHTTHLVEFFDQSELFKRSIDPSSRTVYLGDGTSNLSFLVRQQAGADHNSVHHYPTNRIARHLTAHEPNRIPVEAFELPEKSVVDELLNAYFGCVNPGFPVVDQDRFMAQYQARDPADPPSLLLLHAILLVGTHVSQPFPQRETLKATFFRKAKVLFDTRFERNRDTVVQAALLLTWHSEGPEDVAANAWYWIGVASRTALGLGMHRDTEASNLVDYNKRMWRRVWWLLVQCDVLVSLQYGRPQSLHLEDCDVQDLSPADFEGCGPDTAIDFVIHTTKLTVALSGILRSLGPRITPKKRREALSNADMMLARWSFDLPASLRLRPTLTLEVWPAILQLIYNNALILLHRPRRHDIKLSIDHSETDSTDTDICSAAAGVVQSIFEGLSERDQLKHLWLGSVSIIFSALIQLSAEARSTNPIIAVAASHRYESCLNSLRGLAGYWPSAESVLHLFEKSERLRGLQSLQVANHSTTSSQIGLANNEYDNFTIEPNQSLPVDYNPPILGDEASQWHQPYPHSAVTHDDTEQSRDEWHNIYWEQSGLIDYLS